MPAAPQALLYRRTGAGPVLGTFPIGGMSHRAFMFPGMEAAIYCRISDDRKGDGAGVRRQEVDCRGLCEERGWPVAKVFTDNDLSAYSGKPRPAYEQMLASLKEGAFTAIVAWHPDRLHRSPRELEAFIDTVDAARADVATVRAGTYDLSTATGRMTARIVGATARYESELKSERGRRKALELAQAGRAAYGGSRPYGYDAARLTVRPDEANAIREATRRVLAGEAVRSICRDFDGRGLKPVEGPRWHPSSLRTILMSGRISGQREHHGAIVATGNWPAIISPQETTRLRAVLGDERRRTSRTPRRYLLAGMLRCALCGATLVSRPRADSRRRYICACGPGFSGCGHLYVVADELEALIVEAVRYRLDSPRLYERLARTTPTSLDDLEALLDDAQRQLEELAVAYAEQAITMREWLVARRPIEARAQRARRAIGRLTGAAAVADYVDRPGMLDRDWPTLSLPSQRAIVAAVLDHAVIGPGVRGRNRFDPSRVTPVWKA